jgi:glucokinase
VFLGIEIGGTKLQLGVGPDDGRLRGLWRANVDVAAGPQGIRRQIQSAVPELLGQSGIDRGQLRGIGIGFGGPVDDATHTVIKSHQIEGWDDFPLADWVSDLVGLPAALGNDADVAGLAEALHGAGKGLSPIFYITVGSGIGGGFIINGEIYRGCGRGAAEIGHLRVQPGATLTLEGLASGWGIARLARTYEHWTNDPRPETRALLADSRRSGLLGAVGGRWQDITAQHVVAAAEAGDAFACEIFTDALGYLAEGICHVITLLCPKRIVVGGGVSLSGEKLFFEPLRRQVAYIAFRPFAGLTDIVPAALGEEVVVHGAIALAHKRLATPSL